MSALLAMFGRARRTPVDRDFPLALRVVEAVRETRDAVTLRLARDGGAPLRFIAGQFLTFAIPIDGVVHRRSYSLSSHREMTITVKRVAGGIVSSYLVERARAGMTLRAAGPFGSFTLAGADPDDDWVFVAGGSGITPIAAMIASTTRAVDLLYGNRAEADIVFRERLASMGHACVRHFLESPSDNLGCERGRLDGAAVLAHVGDVTRKRFWICGPRPMMESVEGALLDAGTDPDRIRTEHFTPATEASGDAATVEFARSRRSVRSAPGQSLLRAGLGAGLALDYACEVGECGSCRVRLLDGSCDAPITEGLTEGDRANGFVLACVSRPKGSVIVDA